MPRKLHVQRPRDLTSVLYVRHRSASTFDRTKHELRQSPFLPISASHNSKPPPPLGHSRKLFQFRLRQFAVGENSGQMIADLADDIDREKQFLARTAFPIRVWVRRRKFNYCTRLLR
jgi:hypothetical protein